MTDIRDISTTAASNTSRFPENMAPSAVNDGARDLEAEIAQLEKDEGGTLTLGGTGAAYTVTLNTSPSSLADGLDISATANVTSTGGATTLVATPFGLSAFASKKIKTFARGVEEDPWAGAMVQDGHYDFQYDAAADSGTGAYILLNPSRVGLAHGQCRLTKSSTNLLLSPHNGNQLVINGAQRTIPSAGVTLAPTSLTASTSYNIYAYMNSGTMTPEASTTATATDTTTGVTIKSGDATRTFVGTAATDASVAWTGSIVTWFNRGVTFTSAEQTITSGGALTIAHGLGVTPIVVQPTLVCIATDAGYSVGDVIDANLNSTTATSRFTSIRRNETNLIVRFSDAASVFVAPDRVSGVATALDLTKWRLVLRASA